MSGVTPDDTRRSIEAAQRRLAEGVRGAAVDLIAEVDWRVRRRTPVLKGRARANWRLGLGKADMTVDWDEFDPSGRDGMATTRELLRNYVVGMVVWITNGLVYIPPLERGHSRKAPTGMIAITHAEIPFLMQKIRQGLAGRLHGRGMDQGPNLNGGL